MEACPLQDIKCNMKFVYLRIIPLWRLNQHGTLDASLQDMKKAMESMSQRIISPWNSLLTAVLPFLPKLHDKRPQGMSRVSRQCFSFFYLCKILVYTYQM